MLQYHPFFLSIGEFSRDVTLHVSNSSRSRSEILSKLKNLSTKHLSVSHAEFFLDIPVHISGAYLNGSERPHHGLWALLEMLLKLEYLDWLKMTFQLANVFLQTLF